MSIRRKMMNDEIVSAEGKNLLLQKCKGSYLHGMKIYGRTDQETTTGAQLLSKLPDNITYSGVTLVNNGDSFTLDGVADGLATFSLLTEDFNNLSPGTYTISKDNPIGDLYVLVNGEIENPFVLTGSNKVNQVLLQIPSGTVLSNEKFNIMLNAGSSALPWEPYTGGIPSPNPDYPQELMSAGDMLTAGAQLLDFSSAVDQENTVSGVKATINGDGSYTLTGTAKEAAGNLWFMGGYYPEEANPDVLFALPAGTYSISGVSLYRYKSAISSGTLGQGYTFTLAEDTIITGVRNQGLVVGQTYNDTVYPMLNVGSELLPWEPYTGGVPGLASKDIEVDVFGGNILNPEINSITYMNIRAGTKLTIMTKDGAPSNGGNVLFKTGNDKNVWFGIDTGTNESRIVLSEDVVRFENKLASGIEHALYIGDGKEYETYRAPQPLTMLTSNGLPGIPVSSGGNYTDENGQQWIADYRDWERGVDVQCIGKCVLDGTESWNKRGITNSDSYQVNITNANYGDSRIIVPALCTHFIYNTGSVASTFYIMGHGFLSISYAEYGSSDVNMLKEFLSSEYEKGTPVTVLYQFVTPIETPIPAEELAAYQALHTNTPTTTIVNDEDCWMEVGYRRIRK